MITPNLSKLVKINVEFSGAPPIGGASLASMA
jgi:hypothetical protein